MTDPKIIVSHGDRRRSVRHPYDPLPPEILMNAKQDSVHGERRKVSGPIPIVLLDNGSDKREAPDGAGLVTLILCAVLLAVLAFCGWVVL